VTRGTGYELLSWYRRVEHTYIHYIYDSFPLKLYVRISPGLTIDSYSAFCRYSINVRRSILRQTSAPTFQRVVVRGCREISALGIDD